MPIYWSNLMESTGDFKTLSKPNSIRNVAIWSHIGLVFELYYCYLFLRRLQASTCKSLDLSSRCLFICTLSLPTHEKGRVNRVLSTYTYDISYMFSDYSKPGAFLYEKLSFLKEVEDTVTDCSIIRFSLRVYCVMNFNN